MVSATAMTPSRWSFSMKNSGVFPASESFSASVSKAAGRDPSFAFTKALLPPVSTVPSDKDAVSPFPGSAWKFVTSSGVLSPNASITARDNGCSEFFSRAAAFVSSSSFEMPSAGTRSVTFG